MANFIFLRVITLKQKYARRSNLQAYEKLANKAKPPYSHYNEAAFAGSLRELRNGRPSA